MNEGDDALTRRVHDCKLVRISTSGIIPTDPLRRFRTYSGPRLGPFACGPFGFGRRGRIPFAFSTRSPSLPGRTFVGYQPVGIIPCPRPVFLSITATALMSASVTYKRFP